MAESSLVSLQYRYLQPTRGFTLVELMITVTIVAILLTLATPSYRKFSMRSHRALSITKLFEVAACQERVRALNGSYNTSLCLPASTDYYRFDYETPGNPIATAFRVVASPLSAQLGDDCSSLSLNQDGHQETAGDNKVGKCWAGR